MGWAVRTGAKTPPARGQGRLVMLTRVQPTRTQEGLGGWQGRLASGSSGSQGRMAQKGNTGRCHGHSRSRTTMLAWARTHLTLGGRVR